MPPLSVGEVGVWVSTIYKRLLNYAKFPQLRSSMENSLMQYIATGNVQKEPEAHPPIQTSLLTGKAALCWPREEKCNCCGVRRMHKSR